MSKRSPALSRVNVLIPTILFSAILAACGGGGGSDPAQVAFTSPGTGSVPTSGTDTTSPTGSTSGTSSSTDDSAAASGSTSAAATDPTDSASLTQSVPVIVNKSADAPDASSSGAMGTDSTTVAATTDTSNAASASTDASALALATTTTEVAAAASSAAAAAATSNNYYFDSVAGNDLNSGTQLKPFKTLARLGNVRLKAGQGIYLHCGSVFRETLVLSAPQVVNNTTLGSYGDTCATTPPRVTGADNFSGSWKSEGNGVYSRAVPAGTTKITRLFINGTTMRTAQWPNDQSGVTPMAQVAASSASSKTAFTVSASDAAMLATRDLVGATVQAHTVAWSVDAATVSGIANGVISLSSPTYYTIPASSGYILQDKKWMLDAEGEFFHDTITNTLYIVPPASVAASINSALVEGAMRSTAMWTKGLTALNLWGINFDMARTDGVTVVDSPNALLSGIVSQHNGRAGVRVTSTTDVTGSNRNVTIYGSALRDNSVIGLDAGGANRVTFRNSKVFDTGNLGYVGASLGAVVLGDAGIADTVQVMRSAYLGIRFSGTGGSQVTQSDINSYCLRLSDCGGIYTWNGNKTTFKTVNQTSSVTNNRIGATKSLDTAAPVAGIYLDDYSRGTTASGNSITGVSYGIIIHNGANHTIDNNKVWLNETASLLADSDQTDAEYMVDDVISNNQFMPATTASGAYPALPKFSTAWAVQVLSHISATDAISSGSVKFVNNQYVQAQSGSAPPIDTWSPGNNKPYTINEWKAMVPADGSVATPATFSLLANTLGDELQADGGFDNGLAGWTPWYTSAVLGKLTALSSQSGCSGACAMLTTSNASDILMGQPYSLTANAMYMVKYTAVFGGTATLGTPYLTITGAPFTQVYGSDGLSYVSPVDGTTGDQVNTEGYFHAYGNITARTNLKVRTAGVPIAFDNVSIRPVTGYRIPVTKEWAVGVQATLADAVTVTCASLGWPANCTAIDVNGSPVGLPMTLPKGGSALFLRGDSPLRK